MGKTISIKVLFGIYLLCDIHHIFMHLHNLLHDYL